jgi:uncharacterized protein (TIGR03032 family)
MSADGEVWLAIAGFNCIGRLSSRHSFACAWLPPFISAVVSEDRCHLNGLAMRDDRPAFATAAAACDSLDGWRDRMADGGLVLDVARDAVICEGLSMPHSPRWHNGELWVLNSGAGELVVSWTGARGGAASFP